MFICREALNRSSCDAIHLTEIDTSIECDTFIPAIDTCVYQPWCSSVPISENGLRFCLTSYVRVKRSAADESSDESNGSQSLQFDGKKYLFLPKMIFDQHEEFRYLNLVEDIISNGNVKNDRTGTGTLSKFGCQVIDSKTYFLICVQVLSCWLLRLSNLTFHWNTDEIQFMQNV